MTSVEKAWQFSPQAGETADTPSVVLLDPSEFRRTCIAASLSACDLNTLSCFDHVDDVPDGTDYDLAVFVHEARHGDLKTLEAELLLARKSWPKTKLIMISDDSQDVLKYKSCRIFMKTDSLLLLNLDIRLISLSLRMIFNGYAIFPSSVFCMKARIGDDEGASLVAQHNSIAASHPLLKDSTPRQRDVTELLLAGLSNKQIAEHLSISESTVKAHVRTIMETLDAQNRTQIVSRLTFQGKQFNFPGGVE